MATSGGASDGEAASSDNYCSIPKLRTLTQYTESEISDADIEIMRNDADRGLLQMATVEIYDEELAGDVDGVNKIFTTEHAPIADITFNKAIEKEDVTVHLLDYDDEQNPDSTEAEVSQVNARDGIVTLVTAPTTTNAELGLRIDYRYYVTKVDFDKLELAANYYLAHLCEQKVRLSRGERYTEAPDSSRTKYLITDSSKTYWLSMAKQTIGLLGRPTLEVRER
jgi:hypothetical protein